MCSWYDSDFFSFNTFRTCNQNTYIKVTLDNMYYFVLQFYDNNYLDFKQ